MNDNIKIEFALECIGKKDDQAGVWVGYIPALRIYSQGRDEKELKIAVAGAAELFIVTCYERGILGQALRDRGMTKAAGAHAMEQAKREKHQYISVMEHDPSFDKSFTVKVPISLLAAQQAAL